MLPLPGDPTPDMLSPTAGGPTTAPQGPPGGISPRALAIVQAMLKQRLSQGVSGFGNGLQQGLPMMGSVPRQPMPQMIPGAPRGY